MEERGRGLKYFVWAMKDRYEGIKKYRCGSSEYVGENMNELGGIFRFERKDEGECG
jgi:hypothetical protein